MAINTPVHTAVSRHARAGWGGTDSGGGSAVNRAGAAPAGCADAIGRASTARRERTARAQDHHLDRPTRPLVYAHRGSSAAYAELTRAAYVQALADGADGVECDVQLSRDGHVVLHHDTQLGRTSRGSGSVAHHTLAELKRLDFHSWKGVPVPASHGGPAEQFLTLHELLDLLADATRPVGLAVETKHPSPYGQGLEEAVLVLLMGRGWDPETGWLGNIKISLMSFHPDAVRYVLASVSPRHVCQLVADPTVAGVRDALRVHPAAAAVYRAGLRLVAPPPVPVIARGEVELAGPGIGYVRDHPEQIAAWRANGSVLRVWTVDSFADVHVCLALGVQQITSNVPADVLGWLRAAAPPAPATPPAPPALRTPATPSTPWSARADRATAQRP